MQVCSHRRARSQCRLRLQHNQTSYSHCAISYCTSPQSERNCSKARIILRNTVRDTLRTLCDWWKCGKTFVNGPRLKCLRAIGFTDAGASSLHLNWLGAITETTDVTVLVNYERIWLYDDYWLYQIYYCYTQHCQSKEWNFLNWALKPNAEECQLWWHFTVVLLVQS